MRTLKISAVFISVLTFYNPVSASILSWLTGGSSETTPTPPVVNPPLGQPLPNGKNHRAPIEYPEESGECSHWGNMGTPPYATNDPLFDLSKGIAAPGELVGSHKSVPIGTIVTVTNIRNGKTVKVRVVPPKTLPVFGRVMDLSPAAFAQLENLREGLLLCTVRVIQTPRTEMHALTSHTFDDGGNSGMTALVPRDVSGNGDVEGLGMFGRSGNSNNFNEQYRPHHPVNYY